MELTVFVGHEGYMVGSDSTAGRTKKITCNVPIQHQSAYYTTTQQVDDCNWLQTMHLSGSLQIRLWLLDEVYFWQLIFYTNTTKSDTAPAKYPLRARWSCCSSTVSKILQHASLAERSISLLFPVVRGHDETSNIQLK
jgi:hypothetical protein